MNIRKTNAPSRNNSISDNYYKCLLDYLQPYLPQMVFWKDKNLRYQGCNDRFLELLNLDSAESLIGKTYLDPKWKVSNLTEALLLVHEKTAIQYRAITRYKTTLKFPKQAIFIARIHIVPLLDPTETSVQGIMGVITEENKEDKNNFMSSISSFQDRRRVS